MLPWRSRWSSAKFVHSRASARKCPRVSAWKELTSHTAISPAAPSESAAIWENGVPMFPTAWAGSLAWRRAWTRNSTSVVFPLVPVTATILPFQKSDAKSNSPSAIPPAERTRASQGCPGAKPGEKTARECAAAAAGVNSLPRASYTVKAAPSRPRSAPTPRPLTPSPSTATGRASGALRNSGADGGAMAGDQRSLSVPSPISAKMSESTQKRSTTLVSGQPFL